MAELAGKRMVVVGLGLIGGSLALALDGFEDYTVVGVDVSQPTLRFAREHHICPWVSEDAGREVAQADVVILCLHPQGIVQFLAEYADVFRSGALVTDVCGVKSAIMEGAACLPGTVDFIGGHPMAGREVGGFDHASAELFKDASMILTPEKDANMALLERLKKFWCTIGFGSVTVTTPENHDRVIAYTSQLAHVASSAYIKSPTALDHIGFSAGSYKDLTRVAKLDAAMWTELFMENREPLLHEMDSLIVRLGEYRDALEAADDKRMRALLQAGREQKLEADRKDYHA